MVIKMLKDERNKNYVKNENPYNKYKNNIHNDVLSLYYQFNHLKNIYRQGWLISLLGMDYENRIESVADHTWSVTMLALSIIEKYNLDLNLEKCMKLAIIHELGEVYSGDIIPNVISKEEKHQIEEAAVDELLSPIGFDNDFKELWLEYDNAKSLEADFIKQVDKLEAALQTVSYGLSPGVLKCDNKIKMPCLVEILNEAYKTFEDSNQ